MSDSIQLSRINDVLFYIHQDISRELNAGELAKRSAYSEQHFHRVFKLVVGEPVHQYIRRTRLEYAANQLMFDTKATVVDIANKSGFSSVSSFSRAFKSQFSMSPGEWRKYEPQEESKPYLSDPEIAESYQRIAVDSLPKARIVEVPERYVAYVRHTGYGRSIKQAWDLLLAWAKSEGRSSRSQFGLHHSNPAWVDLQQCRYVACIAIDKPIYKRGIINQFTIPGGLHAVFRLTGKYGELLPQLSLILEHWLPASGFKMQTTPAYAHYLKNHFIEHDEKFEIDFYLPISFY
ncbi:transcription regulator [Vibrio sp. MACH09]|uniref:AraC family transcriptional regulator n=1 Tax=unclassified Vibrio TaxID=2614977 RepID=UPI0014936C92|nr:MULTISPECIES: GyrI-like domain-containing protein [unclassified Vibrio]NOI68605.1 AraC family transcriptional regulator [Vibrio sp. 99-8-1]GLO62905.1 transcription regulator [Vibrio sp. MACH09]